MDLLISIIIKLQQSYLYLVNSDNTTAKLLIDDSIEELIALIAELEGTGEQATDATIPCCSDDLNNSLLAP
jgi:hypothetical protein